MSDTGEVIVSITYDAGQSAQKVIDASNKIMNSAEAVNKSLGGVSRTVSSLATRLDPIGSLIEKLTKQYDQLRAAQEKLGKPNSFTPEMETLLKQGIALLPRLRQEIDGLKTSYTSSANGMDIFNTEVERQNNLLAKSAAITQQVQIDNYNKKMVDQAKVTKDAADRIEILTNKYSQDARASKAYAQTKSELNELMNKGRIGFSEYNVEMNRAIDIYNRSTVSGQKAAESQKKIKEETNRTTFAFGLNRIGMLELQAAGINTFQALASGMSIWRVAVMESAQVVGAVIQGQQSGFSKLKDFMFSVKGGLVGIGAAVVTALGLAIIEIKSSDDRIRAFNVTLNSMSTSGFTSARALDDVVKKLRDTGSAASDAQAAIQAIARTPGINPNAAGDISNVARNISAARGTQFEQEANALTKAIAGGGEALTNYALTIGVKFTPAEQAAINLAIIHRNQTDQLRIAYQAISRTMEGQFGNSLTKTQELITALTSRYHSMMSALGETNAVQTFIRGLEKLGEILEHLFKGDLTIDFKLSPGAQLIIDKILAVSNAIGNFTLPTDEQAAANKQHFADSQAGNQPNLGAGTAGQRWRQMRAAAGFTSTLSVGGGADLSGLSAANVNNKDIQDLNSEFATRVNAFLLSEAGVIINSAARFGSHPSQFNPGGIGLHNADVLGQGLAVDLGNLSQAAAANLAKFGLHQTVRGDWGHVEPIEIPSASVATGPARMQAARQFIAGPTAGPLTNTGMTIGTSAGQTAAAAQTADIKLQAQEFGKWAQELTRAQAEANALKEAEKPLSDGTLRTELEKQNFVTAAGNAAVAKFNDELNKGITIQDAKTKGLFDGAKGYQLNTEEGLKAAAMAEAEIRAKTEGISKEKAYAQILAEGAGQAIKAAAEQNAAQVPLIKGAQDLADAAKISSLAEHDVRIQNEANIVTQKALDAAKAQGITVSSGMVEALNKEARSQLLVKEAAQNSLDTVHQITQARDTQQVLQLQIDLQGKTFEEINRQVAILLEKQKIERETPNLVDSEKEARLRAVAATQDQVVKLGEAVRAQSRFEDGIKSIADSITNDIGSAISDVFSGNKVVDWGTKVKQILGQIVSQLATTQLIKPLFGEVFSALGLTNLGSQFGTFGSNANAVSSLFGGSSSSGSQQITVKSDGTLSLKDVGSGVSSLGKLFSSGSSSGGIFGAGGLFGSQGSLFGTAADISIASGGAPLALDSGLSSVAGLGGGLDAIGGLGSLAGIGSTIGMAIPYVGAAIGAIGLIGSLTGIFGGKPKTKNNFGYGSVNAATGLIDIGGFQSAGNAQNDSTTKQTLNSISQFVTSLNSILPKGTALSSGGVAVATGTKEGTVATLTDQFGNNSMFGNTPEAALSGVELELAKRMTGMSETLKKVVDSVSDASQLQTAIQFAATYDKLNESFAASFSSIQQDTKVVGQFETALNSINDTFTSLKTNAELYGLALDPVNAGLTEAVKELHTSFKLYLDELSLGANDFLTPLQAIHQSFVQNTNDAKVLGENVGDQLSSIEKSQVVLAAVNLSVAQLQKAQEAFATTAPEISSYISDLITAARGLQDEKKITDAFTAALNSISQNTKVLGTFETALNSINDTFKSLSSDAVALGSSLDSVDAGVNKATDELHSSFKLYLNELTLGSNDFLTPLQAAHQSFVQSSNDAKALGEGASEWIASIERMQVSLVASGLNIEQLDKAQQVFAETAPEISKYIDSIISAKSYITDEIRVNEAYKTSLSGIQQNTNTVGQFETALNSLYNTFKVLLNDSTNFQSDKDKALGDLQSSFKLYLAELGTGATDFISPMQAAHQLFVQNMNDSKALGAGGEIQIANIEKSQIAAAALNLNLEQLQKAQKAFAETAPEVSKYLSTLIATKTYLPSEIEQLIQSITDPVGLAIQKEKVAGAERIRVAKDTGDSLVDIAKYNQLSLEQIWKQATASITSLEEQIRTGSLSGLNPLDQFAALQGKYASELKMVQGGNTAELGNLASSAQNFLSASQSYFGNAPKTSDLRKTILNDLDSVLAKKGFAAGTDYLPSGYVLVGENGPEWVKTTGGGSVYPTGQTPRLNNNDGNNAELISELRMLRLTVENSYNYDRAVGGATVERLDKVVSGVNKSSQNQVLRRPV